MKTMIRKQHPLWSDFPSLFDTFAHDWSVSNPNRLQQQPSVNVKETDKDFQLELAAPGFNKEDFKVEVEHDTLTISCENKQESEQSEGKYTRREFQYQSFKRSFTLPKDQVDADHISARYENGIMRVAIPKRQEAQVKPVRNIQIG